MGANLFTSLIEKVSFHGVLTGEDKNDLALRLIEEGPLQEMRQGQCDCPTS